MDESNKKIYLSISKENDNIRIYDDIILERTITCKIDKATSKRIYLNCYDPNARYDFFKYPYIKLAPQQYNLKIEFYRNSFNGTGKENYYKYNCDKEEDSDHYTIECKESNWWISKFEMKK